ncbi:hypothetical protein [Desulfonatronum thioautotrophicum]|uniref:hypothetical protein n=1 Tax=Desulfonatronum thioautotrophicum TaxID=617001 RepID=UPI0005EB3654|nr:hypothetical protein [Desulfonatronum thioautotrophicum]
MATAIYGHLDGDNVLKALTRLLAPGNDLDSGKLLAEKLRLAVVDHDFPIPCTVPSSFGVAAYQPGDTELSLANRADQALYRAKE